MKVASKATKALFALKKARPFSVCILNDNECRNIFTVILHLKFEVSNLLFIQY